MHSPDPFIAALPTDPREAAEFALEVGVSMSTFWRWRKGKARPNSHATRQRVVDVLRRRTGNDDYTVDTLFATTEVAA